MRVPSLLELLEAPWGFDLRVSPLQAAIARAAEGQSLEGVDAALVERHFGCSPTELQGVLPALVVIVAGVRGGKSLIAGAAAVRSALAADLSRLRPHETARVAIVAPSVDNATATFRLLTGALMASPVLKRLVVGLPTSDTVSLRRADGRVVEIVVVAAHRGGLTLRSRWLAGVVLDEVALFGADETGAAVNAEELLRAAEARLVKGAQAWLISSPFGPHGLLYALYKKHFGAPGRVLVVHAPTLALNPTIDPAMVAAVRARDPDAAAREFDAEWVDADTAFLDGVTIDAAVREKPLELPPGGRCHAAWDVAFRGNSWTLVVARGVREEGAAVARVVVVLARQWTGSRTVPLDPTLVLREVSSLLARYGVQRVWGDSYGIDALRPLARAQGLSLREKHTTPEDRYEQFATVKHALATGRLELPPVPALVSDLKAIRKKATVNAVRVDLPRTSDGRHCDFAPALALALAAAQKAPDGGIFTKTRVPREPAYYWQSTGGSDLEVGSDGRMRLVPRTRTGARRNYSFARRSGGF